MAKTTQNDHVVRVSADFSDLVRASKKAGEKSADLIGSAIQKGIATRTFSAQMESLKKFEKKRLESEKKFADVVEGREKFAAQTAKKTRAMTEKLASLEQTLSEKNLKASTERRKKAERDLLQERIRSAQEAEKLMEEGSVASLQKVSKELDIINQEHLKISKSLDKATEQMIRGSERAADFMKFFRRDASQGAADFNEKLQSSLENLKSGLSNVDIGSMLSSGVGSLGKGLGGLSEVASGLAASGGAMGSVAAAMSGILLVMAPLVLAFGAFSAVMFGIDKEIKELDKSAINTFGTRGVMNIGMPKLTDNLRVLRHATQDLTATLGLSESEAVGVFDAFDAGGISLGRFTKGAVDAADAEARLSAALRGTVSVAKSLGIGVNEFATTLADYSDSLASSLEGVTDQFALVGRQAQDAGFSTRRFYSLITQASAGQASLNTHLDQTADLLVRMTKILGEKAGGEVLAGANAGLGDMSTQDRTRMVMTTGRKRTTDIVSQDADSQAHNFVSDLSKSLGSPEVARAFATASAAGVTLSDAAQTDSGVLVRELSSLSRSDQAVLTTAFESSTDKTVSGLGRRLDQLTKLARGTSGELFDLTDSFSALSAGATVQMKLSSVDAITGGVPFNELSGPLRMAAESISGMSGNQIEQYQALAAASEGSLQILQSIQRQGIPSDETKQERDARIEDQDKRFGGHIDDNGEIVTASGLAVENSTQLLTAMVERGDAEVTKAREESLDLAYDAFDATTTIADILENKILFYLRGLYEDVGQPLITWLSQTMGLGGSSELRQSAISARGALRDTSERAMGRASEAGRTISSLSIKESQKTITEEEAASLAAARQDEAAARGILKEAGDTLRELSSGDYSSLTGTRTRTVEAPRISSHLGRFEGADPVGPRTVTESYTLTAEELARSIESRGGAAGAASVAGASAPVAATAPSPVSVVAPPVAPSVAGPTATATTAASEDAADLVTQPIVAAQAEATAVVAEEASSTRSVLETEGEASRKHLDKILTKDLKFGNALARSNLPDAIVAAQVKQQIASLALASGLNGEDAAKAVTEYMESGTVSKALTESIKGLDETGRRDLGGLAGSLGMRLGGGLDGTGAQVLDGRRRLTSSDGPEMGEEVNDFIYQGDGIRGTITPIDPADTFVGSKPGGALDRAGGGGGSVSIAIYGGDERRVFDVVKRVLRESGLGSGRVTSRA